MTPTPRRNSVGSGTPELLTPRSYSGRQNGYFKEMRRLSTAPLNFVAISKEDTMSYASVYGSESGSPPRLNWNNGNWYVLRTVDHCLCCFIAVLSILWSGTWEKITLVKLKKMLLVNKKHADTIARAYDKTLSLWSPKKYNGWLYWEP